MTLTIVIPVRNRARLVGRTLDSVAAQRCRDFRLVLVDNASTDATLPALRGWAAAHPDVDTTVVEEHTPGAAAARNRGLREVATPWVMFFDSDDVMAPGHVERALAVAAARPEADIIGWDISIVGLDGRGRRHGFPTGSWLYANLFYLPMATQRYMVRTEVVRRVGGWNPSVMAWNDIELANRMLLRCHPRIVHAGPEVTVTAYAQAASITGTAFAPGAGLFDRSVEAIALELPPERRHLAMLKRVILAGRCSREGSPKGRALYRRALAEATCRRGWLRLAYHYTRLGGRGIARLLRPVMAGPRGGAEP